MCPWLESYITTQLARDLWNDCSSVALKISFVASGALNDLASSSSSDSMTAVVLG